MEDNPMRGAPCPVQYHEPADVDLIAESRDIIHAGGIWWRCSTCKTVGALKPDSPVAAMVRARLGIPAPRECGVVLTNPTHCPVCRGELCRDADQLH